MRAGGICLIPEIIMFLQLPDIIILAGGLGTRLRDVVGDAPKSMALVKGKPFLEYQLNFIKKAGFRRVILSTGYKGEMIKNHFGSSYNGLELLYSHEENPLGTGGAVKQAFELVETPHALIMNGDTMFRINLDYFFQSAVENLSEVYIALRFSEDASRFGLVEMNHENRIVAFREKSTEASGGLINGGIYIISAKSFHKCSFPEVFSLERDFFAHYLNNLLINGQIFDDFFLDIGIPEDYNKAQDLFNDF